MVQLIWNEIIFKVNNQKSAELTKHVQLFSSKIEKMSMCNAIKAEERSYLNIYFFFFLDWTEKMDSAEKYVCLYIA